MFGSLKSRLKEWVSKNTESEEVIVEAEEKKTTKPKKTKESKVNKGKTKEEKAKSKEIAAKEKIEEKERKKEERKKVLEDKKKFKKKIGKEEIGKIVEDTEEILKSVEKQIEEVIENAEEIIEENPKKISRFTKILTEEKFESMFEELEIILLTNNVAYDTVDKIKRALKEKLIGNSLKQINLAKELKNSIEELLINPPDFIKTIKDSIKEKSPYVILFSGINGAGKTTTIAKVTKYLQDNKLSICLAAADTFRAAAIQQLEVHANSLHVPIIKKNYGTDPAAVAFDAVSYAKKHKINVVLIDTAGRLQNKDSLMKEIEKISRVAKADMKIFLGESITGNDATKQAKAFNEAINIDGIILSKVDIDEKGGTAISVATVTGKPILFLGTGQQYEDLEVFDKEKLIKKLGL